jgi:V/A-type H+-transporting ATPase subunit E
MSRAQSSAMLQEKKLILEAKQQIITDIIASAKDHLLNLSDEEYFISIISMIKRYTLPEAGQILFSTKDNKRLPVQFEDFINSSLTDKMGAALTISKEARDINGGFILIYGDVEVNCSFDALFFAAKENLQDKVRALLFV